MADAHHFDDDEAIAAEAKRIRLNGGFDSVLIIATKFDEIEGNGMFYSNSGNGYASHRAAERWLELKKAESMIPHAPPYPYRRKDDEEDEGGFPPVKPESE